VVVMAVAAATAAEIAAHAAVATEAVAVEVAATANDPLVAAVSAALELAAGKTAVMAAAVTVVVIAAVMAVVILLAPVAPVGVAAVAATTEAKQRASGLVPVSGFVQIVQNLRLQTACLGSGVLKEPVLLLYRLYGILDDCSGVSSCLSSC